MLEGQNTVRGQIALRSLGLHGIPITNVENACASGSTALLQATAWLRAGLADVALAVGAEKMFFPEKNKARASIDLWHRRSRGLCMMPSWTVGGASAPNTGSGG